MNKPIDSTNRGIACQIYEKRDGIFVVESTDDRLSEFVGKEHESLATLYDAIDKLSDSHDCGLFIFLDLSPRKNPTR